MTISSGPPPVRSPARSRQFRQKPSSTPSPLSLFVGHLGVAYAAHRIAALTDTEDLVAEAEWLLDGLFEGHAKPHPLDMIGGNAGAIPPLLALSRSTGGTRERTLAIALGEQLCKTAIRQGETWTWDPEIASGPDTASAPLTGMSHGASGIGVALLRTPCRNGRSRLPRDRPRSPGLRGFAVRSGRRQLARFSPRRPTGSPRTGTRAGPGLVPWSAWDRPGPAAGGPARPCPR